MNIIPILAEALSWPEAFQNTAIAVTALICLCLFLRSI